MEEHDIVVLKCGTDGVAPGTTGTIVHSYRNGAYEVEFIVNEKSVVLNLSETQITKKP